MDAGLIACGTGVDDGHCPPPVIQEVERVRPGQDLPEGYRRRSGIIQPEALVAAGADVDQLGLFRELRVLAAAGHPGLSGPDGLVQESGQAFDRPWLIEHQGASGGEASGHF